jgi:ADP-ribose pyrophosphatase YjhB (NUDIX family)
MIIGVGFLFLKKENGVFRVYTVRELLAKPEYEKEPGMISFPLETVNPNEAVADAIHRLIKEEIGLPRGVVKIESVSPKKFRPIPSRQDVVIYYGYGFLPEGLAEDFQPGDDDVVFAGWLNFGELLYSPRRRLEVAPILLDFLCKHSTSLF